MATTIGAPMVPNCIGGHTSGQSASGAELTTRNSRSSVDVIPVRTTKVQLAATTTAATAMPSPSRRYGR